VALLTDEPLYPKNKCYKWTVDHLLRLDDRWTTRYSGSPLKLSGEGNDEQAEDEMDTLLCKLARYYASLSYDDVPAEVIEKAKRSLVDFLSELAAGFYVESWPRR